jgi:hypothetical protein
MAQTDSSAKNSFVLYCDLLQKLERLTIEQKGFVFQAILEFQNGIEPQVNDPMAQLSFDFIKLDLIKNNEKYQDTVNRNRANGAKGGRPRKENPENPVGFTKSGGLNKNPNIPVGYEETEGLNSKPKKADNENDNENDKNTITAGAVANFYDKFSNKKQQSPTLHWQADAMRLAEQLKLDLDATFEKTPGGKPYKISDSWFRLFRDGGSQVASRLEAAYSYFADQERFLSLPDDVKWGYLRDIAHNGLDKFKQKGYAHNIHA